MPMRDHFRPPLDDLTSWEGVHHQWPAMMVIALRPLLPPRFRAEPGVHRSGSFEIDVSTYERADEARTRGEGEGEGGVALAVAARPVIWAPPQPTCELPAGLLDQDEFAVLVYDSRRQRRLVAAIEIVSPANKDRPESRELFVGKCVALLQQRVTVVVVDLVTTRHFNLYDELLAGLGLSDPALSPGPPGTYAVSCRWTPPDRPAGPDGWRLRTWYHPLEPGRQLATLPLWLTDDFAVPLELEESYEAACDVLQIP